MDLEFAMPLMSRIELSSPPPSSSPIEFDMLPHPKPPSSPLSLFVVSTPTTPPPWPPTTAFFFTCSKGVRSTSEPSNVKDPCICAYPIIIDSDFGGLRDDIECNRRCAGRAPGRMAGCVGYSEASVSEELLLME